MQVKLVRQHGLKAAGFFQKNKGTVFDVIQKRPGGYDVDLAPLGHPGVWGWMHDGEVEEIATEDPQTEMSIVRIIEDGDENFYASLRRR